MLGELFTWSKKGKLIEAQVKKNKSVIYGGQAIKKHIGPYARETRDYDVLSKVPRKSANQIERKLDKHSEGDYYYVKQSKFHKGTFKVYHKGTDNKKGTRDDVGVADYSKMRKVKYKIINGIKYIELSETIKDKKKALRDKAFEFRWKKDQEDLDRIALYKKSSKRRY